MKVTGIETLHCDGGWRNYSFVKLTTDEGIVGWSEYDEGLGSPGVTAAIERLAERVVGEDVSAHERIYAKLYGVTRPATGGVVAEAMGAIENALLDAKAKRLGLPCYELLGGKQRDRIAHRDRSTCRKADLRRRRRIAVALGFGRFSGISHRTIRSSATRYDRKRSMGSTRAVQQPVGERRLCQRTSKCDFSSAFDCG
jgi:L-alanine-DL-glutamate epimerase-like enolase superfamily enzyme